MKKYSDKFLITKINYNYNINVIDSPRSKIYNELAIKSKTINISLKWTKISSHVLTGPMMIKSLLGTFRISDLTNTDIKRYAKAEEKQ